jgi:hypothetical protein
MAGAVDPYMISTAVLSVIIIAVSIVALMKSRVQTLPTLNTGGLQQFSYIMVLFLPHILTIFGFIADALSQDFRYSIGSIIGFLSIFLNYGMSMLIGKVVGMASSTPAAVPPPVTGGGGPEGCFIPGFDSFVSDYSSAPLVVTISVMTYYLIDMIVNRGFYSSISPLVTMLAFMISQTWVLNSNGCFAKFSGLGVPLAFSSIIGGLIGWGAYATVVAVAPERLPSVVYTQRTSSPTTRSPVPGGSGCAGGQCGAPADDDQFVCDSYINGMPATK